MIDGLVLSGGTATYVAPEYDTELGIAHGVTPAALIEAFERAPYARAAFVVSPKDGMLLEGGHLVLFQTTIETAYQEGGVGGDGSGGGETFLYFLDTTTIKQAA